MTNLKNRLMVQKVDDQGEAVNGAVLALFQVSNFDPDSYSLEDAFDYLTTSEISETVKMSGGGIFPSRRQTLPNGEYYLVEISAPEGYELNPLPIHVIIDNTGVYADAGTADDNVSVLRGVGSVMRSMVSFAFNDAVDPALYSIQATLLTSDNYVPSETNWITHDETLHLQFANVNKVLDYGLHDAANPGTLDSLTLSTDSGWSRLLIQQCLEHNQGTGYKTNLSEEDISALFSGTVIVRVMNRRLPLQGPMLPETGGSGDLVFLLAGLLCLSVALTCQFANIIHLSPIESYRRLQSCIKNKLPSLLGKVRISVYALSFVMTEISIITWRDLEKQASRK